MPTEQNVTRKLRAILSADVKGYSLLMADDEAYTIRKLEDYRTRMSNLIRANSGRVVDAVGDNLLAEFSSAVDAVQCAVEIQKALKIKNAEIPEDKRLNFRIGINIGDVVQDGDRIYGSGVNVAARIEGLADPGGVSISRSVYDQIKDKLTFGYEYLGDHEVKNIKDPVRVYKVLMDPEDAGKLIGEAKKRPKQNLFMIGIAAVIIIVLGIAFWQFYVAKKAPYDKDAVEQTASSLGEKPSIAVLPFDNMSNDPEQEYFSDGITDNIITDLSKLSGLKVISRNSTFTYKGKEIKIPEVAGELGVRYVLEGSIQRAGNQIRINAQLIDSQTNSHVWAERFDDTMENIFELQDNITDKIVSQLAVTLTPDEHNRIADKGTKNISAYDVYLKGVEHFEKFTPQDFLKAIEYYQQALEIDPDFKRVNERLAEVYWMCNMHGYFNEMNINPFTARLKARKYLELAFKNREPTFRVYPTAAAMALFRRQFDKAIKLAEKGVKLAPNEWRVNFVLGSILSWSGSPEEGITYINKSIEMDPRSRIGWKLCELGRTYFTMGQLEKAIEYIKKGQQINPRLINYSGTLAASYAHLGRQAEGKAVIENYLKSFAIFHVPSFYWINYGTPYKDYEVYDRFATGLAKAGYPGNPKNYYKVYEENKLTEEEIKKIYSPPIKIAPGGEAEGTWYSYHENGEAYFDKPHPYFGSPSKGKWWINGDMVCSQWETIFDNLTSCSNIYYLDESDGPSKYKYIQVSDLAHGPFSIE